MSPEGLAELEARIAAAERARADRAELSGRQRGWYDWRGAVITGSVEADTCEGQVDRLRHWLHGGGLDRWDGPIMQALTACGKRATRPAVGGEITCPRCAAMPGPRDDDA